MTTTTSQPIPAAHIPHTRLHKPKPPHTTRDPTAQNRTAQNRTPAATSVHPPPKVSYILRPRPLPISGAFSPDQLRAMIDRLPDARHREIITMRYAHGYQWEDIAATMHYERTAIWRMHKAAMGRINQMVHQRIGVDAHAVPVKAKTPRDEIAQTAIGMLIGAALVAVLWWVTDAALNTSAANIGSTSLTDANTARLWMIGLYLLGCVQCWFARAAFERMPVVTSKTTKATREAATSTSGRPKKSSIIISPSEATCQGRAQNEHQNH